MYVKSALSIRFKFKFSTNVTNFVHYCYKLRIFIISNAVEYEYCTNDDV